MSSPDEASDVNLLTATLALGLLGTATITSPSAAAQTRVNSDMLVSTSWLHDRLADGNLVILCVGRSRSGYDAGHIPGARFLPLDELVEQHANSLNDLPSVATLRYVFGSLGVSDDSRIILYGEGGGLLAARAYFTLDYLGHAKRAALLDGGLEKWTAEARPLSHQPARPEHADLTPHVQGDVLITTSQMRDIVTHADAQPHALLDSRPPREFDGTVMSEAVPKAGHIPGAQSLYWKTLLQSESVPSLLDAETLQRTFAASGADSSKLVVTYCRTGMQSSFTYFVAKYLGYRAAMYDGSVYEWVNRAGYDLVLAAPSPSTDSAQQCR